LEDAMRKRLAILLFCLAAMPLAANGQDWRGRGRIDGWVRNEKGEPIEGATVKMSLEKETAGPSAKTNKKGYWAILGIAGGKWNMDISASGYETRQLSMTLSEATRTPAVEVKLKPAETGALPGSGVQGGAASAAAQEIKAAIETGNSLLSEKKYAQARAEYEKALVLVPDNPAILKGIAQTYHAEKNTEKEIELLRKLTQLDPSDSESRFLLGSLLVQQGKLEEGKEILDALPPGAIKDPGAYVNLGILFMNKNNPEQARVYLTKAIETSPAQPESYYYRGLALMQLKKNADAKVDFHKYLELAPNGAEAKEVREILQAFK